jgi:hypothetical protein
MKAISKSLLNLSKGKRIDLIHLSNFDKMDSYVTFSLIKDKDKTV